MMKNILAWLFVFFYTPVPNKVIQPPEVETMSEPLVDESETVVEAAPAAVVSEAVSPAVAAEVKTGVADFEAALSFVESGVAQLGEAAKDELKELAKKYL
jgi:hypothetical protein